MSAVRFRRFAPMAAAAALWFAALSASAATFVVDSTGDESDDNLSDGICHTALGTCTLRAAIEQANALPGADTINFNIAGAGVQTISPALPLPVLIDDAGTTIDGYTQPGAAPNTLDVGNDAVLLIEIDGTNAGIFTNGLTIASNGPVTIQGLVINRFSSAGIMIGSIAGHSVKGCFLGSDPTGKVALGNHVGLSIEIGGGGASRKSNSSMAITTSATVVIGGIDSDRNLISGNLSEGLAAFTATDCLILNNYIGTDFSGTAPLPNLGNGVSLAASSVSLGPSLLTLPPKPLPGMELNVISGNVGAAVVIGFGGTNSVTGNLIGTDPTGAFAIPNGSGVQVVISRDSLIRANVISGNLARGIRVFNSVGSGIFGNRIGTDFTGALPLGNGSDGVSVAGPASSSATVTDSNKIAYNGGAGVTVGLDATDATNDILIEGNSIHDNAGLGIDLGNDGFTPNNDCDTGRGPNLGQNFPVLTAAIPTTGNLELQGHLNSAPNTRFVIDFYANALCDASGYGEGETYLGLTSVLTDSTCNISFDITLPVTVAPGSFITATATDLAGNTSEFSACFPVSVGMDFYATTPCRLVDTRGPAGPFGGPALVPGADRGFPIAGQCGIPAEARSVAFNFTVTRASAAGDVQIAPNASLLPLPPQVFYSAGQTRAKQAVLPLGADGAIVTRVDQSDGTVDLIIDVAGYFR